MLPPGPTSRCSVFNGQASSLGVSEWGSQAENPQARQRCSSWANWGAGEGGSMNVVFCIKEVKGPVRRMSLRPWTQALGIHDESRTEPLLSSRQLQVSRARFSEPQTPGTCMGVNCVQLLVTPWAVAHQAPLSMGFSRQECRTRLPFPTPRDLPNPWIQCSSPASPTLAGGFFTTEPPGKPSLQSAWDTAYCKSCSPGYMKRKVITPALYLACLTMGGELRGCLEMVCCVSRVR